MDKTSDKDDDSKTEESSSVLKNLKLSIFAAIIITILFILSPDKFICRFVPYSNFITRPFIKPIIKFFLIVTVIFIILLLGN